jgi:DNA-binding PadR family transcriptional regulator
LVNETAEELKKRIVKSFMDILILEEINSNAMSGYDVISFIHKKYDILVSAGTDYSLMYSLERDGLLEAIFNKRRRVYTLTEKGKQNMPTITKASTELRNILRNMSSLSG